MNCPLCKGDMEKGFTSIPFELSDDHFVVVKHVPAFVCSQCSEPYIDMAVAREIEKLIADAEKKGVVLGVIQYQDAA